MPPEAVCNPYMFAYLGLMETVAKCAVDMVTLLLVAKGKEFKVPKHRKWKIFESWRAIKKQLGSRKAGFP